MPALFTSVSMRPHAAITPSTMRAMLALSVTSMRNASAAPPSSTIASATRCASPMLMSHTATFAPSRANLTAVASPMPDAEPVMIATFPGKRMKPLPGRGGCAAALLCDRRQRRDRAAKPSQYNDFLCVAQDRPGVVAPGCADPDKPVKSGCWRISAVGAVAAPAGRHRTGCCATTRVTSTPVRSGGVPMLDDELQRLLAVVPVDLHAEHRVDARWKLARRAERDGAEALVAAPQHELRMRVGDHAAREHVEDVVERRRRESLSPDRLAQASRERGRKLAGGERAVAFDDAVE